MKILHIINKLDFDSCSTKIMHDVMPHFGVKSYLAFAEKVVDVFCCEAIELFQADDKNLPLGTDRLSTQVEEILQAVDVVHLHTSEDRVIANVLPYIKKLDKPVVWSLDRCNAYTAVCDNHKLQCALWQEGCQDCPLVESEALKNQYKNVFAAKRNLYQDMRLSTVSMSTWQASQVSKSVLGQYQSYQMPLPIDKRYFYPEEKSTAKNRLGLHQQGVVIVCQSVNAEVQDSLYQALLQLRDNIVPITLVYLDGSIEFPSTVCEIRNLPSVDATSKGMYFRAAELYMDMNMETVYQNALEAQACGTPCLLLDYGCARELIDDSTGFLLTSGDVIAKSLFHVLLRLMKQRELSVEMGQHAAMQSQRSHDIAVIAKGFTKLYSHLTQQVEQEKRLLATDSDEFLQALDLVNGSDLAGFFAKQVKPLAGKNKMERLMYVDKFCLACLDSRSSKTDNEYIWQVVAVWLEERRGQELHAQVSSEAEREGYLAFVIKLRSYLTEYLRRIPLEEFARIEVKYGSKIVTLWHRVFLNIKSILNIAAKEEDIVPAFTEFEPLAGYPFIYLRSMYIPYWQGDLVWGAQAIVDLKILVSLKFIALEWLVSLPFYNATEINRKIVLHYIKDFCLSIMKNPTGFDKQQWELVIGTFMEILWRTSYLGGNNIETLRAYGDFLQDYAKRYYSEFCQPIKPRKRKRDEKIRIGYVSLRFRNQAVSQYMANRIFCHDKERFQVKTFILQAETDGMTEQIKAASDEVAVFGGVSIENALSVFAKSIKDSDLDILIYADIGMDNVTYSLGAMRLAPVQAVLVGHGTTTGLTTIDYYLSGDHEPQNAQKHYVEKIIKLPKLGCVQLPPQQTDAIFSRADLGVPDDAVMFISCANGLKHIPDRDHLFIDILKQAENAYIVLKPFQNAVTSDHKFIERVKKAAVEAGVADRLIFVSPLKNAGDLMGLLVLADVQLDTYPYGGWTTNLEALYYHIPIVTQEGNMARNRWGAGLIRQLGIEDGIARNEKEYVDWAVRFAKDENFRRSVSERIEQKAKATLFNGEAGQAVYETTLLHICK